MSTAGFSAPNERRCVITRLSLRDFRNHETFDAETGGGHVVLTGPNGAGKTNILEAISLLAPGRGMRRAKLAAMVRQTPEGAAAGWTVSATLSDGATEQVIGTGYRPDDGERRQVRVDGETLRSATRLGEHVGTLWLTPQSEQIFLEASGERRRFLDRLVYGFDPSHASRVAQYEHAMRERNRLLSFRAPDSAWLGVLEMRMAENSTAIAASRLETVERLNHEMRDADVLARPQLVASGDAEALLDTQTAREVSVTLKERLEAGRAADAMNGRSGWGAHRTQLLCWHDGHGREAEYCSTGEQKTMLIAILLAVAQSLKRWHGRPPLLLFDEIVSHLDAGRRDRFLEIARDVPAQMWMTGTSPSDFAALDCNRVIVG